MLQSDYITSSQTSYKYRANIYIHVLVLVDVIPGTHCEEGPPEKPKPTTSDIRTKPEKVGNEEESNTVYDGEEDEEVIEEAHRHLLNIFDKSWEPLPEKVYRDKTALRDRVLKVIADSRWERTLPLSKTLDQRDGENQSLLNMLLTRMPKRNSNNRSPRDSFARRKELVRFLMNEYPQLYSYPTNDDRTVLKAAYSRAQVKDEKPQKVFATEFIHLLVTEYPEETARELNNATPPYKAHSRGPLCIQELIPVVKGLPEKLLDHLKPELVREAADDNGNSVLHLLAEYATKATDLKALVTKYPEALSARNKSSHSPYQHRVFVRESEDQKFNPEHDDVVKYLKDEYMHLPNPEETIQCLYGASKGMFHALGIAFIPSFTLVTCEPVGHTGSTNSLG